MKKKKMMKELVDKLEKNQIKKSNRLVEVGVKGFTESLRKKIK